MSAEDEMCQIKGALSKLTSLNDEEINRGCSHFLRESWGSS